MTTFVELAQENGASLFVNPALVAVVCRDFTRGTRVYFAACNATGAMAYLQVAGEVQDIVELLVDPAAAVSP